MMTLSASDPWATVLAAQAPGWVAGLERDHPELYPVIVAVRGSTVEVTAPIAPEPWSAVRILAWSVAEWWPGWLHPAGVTCRISASGVTVAADADAMFDLAVLTADLG